MNDFRSALARLHDPLKSDGMVLGHRRSHDHDGVGVAQVLLRSRGAASPERCPQTGDSGAVSYTGLVGEAHHAQAGSEELFDQIIFFDVESCAAEVSDGGSLH